jgi:hypothetical protein
MQLARVGIQHTVEGVEELTAHFQTVVMRSDNIIRTWSDKFGTFQIRESFFAGPGGFLKFHSTWEVLGGGSYRFVTAIPIH